MTQKFNSLYRALAWALLGCLGISSIFAIRSNAQVQTLGQLQISEINFAGSIRDGCPRCNRDKWVELHNPGNTPVSLRGWSLRMRGSSAKTDNVVLPEDAVIPPSGYYLVAYREKGLISTLNSAGILADAYSGKILNLSNVWEAGRKYVDIALIDSTGGSVSRISLNNAQTEALQTGVSEGNKYSIQPGVGEWKLSSAMYFAGNYGTPKSSLVPAGVDLDQATQPAFTAVQPTSPAMPSNSRIDMVQAPAPMPDQVVKTVPSVNSIPATLPAANPALMQIPQAISEPAPATVQANRQILSVKPFIAPKTTDPNGVDNSPLRIHLTSEAMGQGKLRPGALKLALKERQIKPLTGSAMQISLQEIILAILVICVALILRLNHFRLRNLAISGLQPALLTDGFRLALVKI